MNDDDAKVNRLCRELDVIAERLDAIAAEISADYGTTDQVARSAAALVRVAMEGLSQGRGWL